MAGSRYGNVRRYRHEYKYIIGAEKNAILSIRAKGCLRRDPYVLEDGTYTIRSVYFDDLYDTCLKDNIFGKDPRSKFRIRYYNDDTSHIMLEKKSKCRGMTLKDSCTITLDECKHFLLGDVPVIRDDMDDMKKKLFAEILFRNLKCHTIVTYNREPFVYSGGNVRVTFDRDITSSNQLNKFLSGTYIQRPILPAGKCVLEVKWDEIIPKHIKETLQLEYMSWTAFSKYALCRQHHI